MRDIIDLIVGFFIDHVRGILFAALIMLFISIVNQVILSDFRYDSDGNPTDIEILCKILDILDFLDIVNLFIAAISLITIGVQKFTDFLKRY